MTENEMRDLNHSDNGSGETVGRIDRECSSMLQETGEHIIGDYMDVFFEIFEDMKIGADYPTVPLEVLEGIAIAFAYASGYRVVLQAGSVEPLDGKFRTVYRDVLIAEP